MANLSQLFSYASNFCATMCPGLNINNIDAVISMLIEKSEAT